MTIKPYLYIFLAIILLVFGKVLDLIVADEKILNSSIFGHPKIYIVILSSLVSGIAIYFFIVYAQGLLYQQINSKVVVDFSIHPRDFSDNPDTILTISNKGLVGIEDVTVYLTQYDLKPSVFDDKGHWLPSRDKLDKVYTRCIVSDKNRKPFKISSGKTLDIKLNSYLQFGKFPLTNFSPDMQKVYTARIVFRNSFNKEKYVKYLIFPAYNGMPTLYGNWEEMMKGSSGTSSPFNNSNSNIFEDFKKAIFQNQSLLFGDNLAGLYQN